MEIDVNIKNPNKHWILVILGKIKDGFLTILKFFASIIRRIIQMFKKTWKAGVGVAVSILLIVGGIYGISSLKLHHAVKEITKTYESSSGDKKADYAYKLLYSDTHFGYKNVPDWKIKDKLKPLLPSAFQFLEEQAYAGNAKCQNLLGDVYYRRNNYISTNNKKAAYWWNEAANNGYIPAYYKIGFAFKNGNGVEVDIKKAATWLKAGAEAGEAWAQKHYGDLFVNGANVVSKRAFPVNGEVIIQDIVDEVVIPKDIEQAKYWWGKAAAQGNKAAKDALEQIYN